MDYKKIFKSRALRQVMLRVVGFVPDKLMLKWQYRIKLDRKLDLKNPKRFTEKLQWYKLNYRDPLMKICADKYTVRDHIKSKGLEHTLNQLYGVYDSVDEIDVATLPEKFVVKTSNGGGGLNVFLCRDKSTFDKEAVKAAIGKLRKVQDSDGGREWVYNEYDRGKRVNGGLDTLFGHTVYQHGERLEINARGEIADYEIVKRHRKRHYHSRENTGHYSRELNLEK